MLADQDYSSPSPSSSLIREMSADDRPREKALRLGIKNLSDAELMAIIFGTGMKGKSVIQLSEEILHDNDHHLSKVARLSVRDFMNRYKGMGVAKAVSMLAALELGARSASDAVNMSNPKVTSSKIASDLMRRHLSHLPHEEFWIMLLNQGAAVIKEVCVGRGGVAATFVDIKIVLKHIVENYASSVILFHNHPSGSLFPSSADDTLTRRICRGVAAIGSRVNDHIILTDSGYFSYNDNGRLPTITFDND